MLHSISWSTIYKCEPLCATFKQNHLLSYFFVGNLDKPIIKAEPGTVITYKSAMTIWCQGSLNAELYALHKQGNPKPWVLRSPEKSRKKGQFLHSFCNRETCGNVSMLLLQHGRLVRSQWHPGDCSYRWGDSQGLRVRLCSQEYSLPTAYPWGIFLLYVPWLFPPLLGI